MGFYIYDSNGYVGDLASNKGLVDLSVFIRKYSDGDELNSLFENGHVLKTEHLLEEIKRIGIPKEVAICVSFLLNENNSYMTGATIDVNGGLYSR